MQRCSPAQVCGSALFPLFPSGSTHPGLGARGRPRSLPPTYWWHQTRTSARLPRVRLHDLRHFYASGLIAAGCDVVTVQRALGHGKATTTLNTYSHLWPTAEDRTRQAAAALMAAVAGESRGLPAGYSEEIGS
jgi:integrase